MIELSPIQTAILLLSKSLNISVESDGYGETILDFSGKLAVEDGVVEGLAKAGLITLGYRTGRIKLTDANAAAAALLTRKDDDDDKFVVFTGAWQA